MNKTLFVSTLLIAVPLALSAVLLLHPTRASTEDTPSANEVRVDNFSFGPETLTVPLNSTVTWVNKDDVPHVIASNAGLFKSKALDTDDKFSFTFSKTGTYAYYCSVHPKMVGKIVVQ
jgi:plastocyanin